MERIEGFQKVFSTQSAKVSLKGMADGDLGQFRRDSYSDSYN
jgi:hypothetical protein